MSRTFISYAGLVVVLMAGGSVSAQSRSAEVPECAATHSQDGDGDGLSDACELALARTFAPLLMVRGGGCNWDSSAPNARLGGGYFHAVQPVDGGVRIAYLPAYFRDCGWSGAKCSIPWVDCSPHDGDSEFIAVEVIHDQPAAMVAVGVFLSAHCFGRSSGSCRWYRGEELDEFDWIAAAPVVWVSEGRQANYPSWQACDAGHRYLDTCDAHDTSVWFPVLPARNIGSRAVPQTPGGCVTGAILDSVHVEPDAQECFWRPEPFHGWQAAGGKGVTPYVRYLEQIEG